MLLDAQKSVLLVVDAQASLMSKVIDTGRVAAVIAKLISVARELDVPIVVTEQYPEGLKPTIPEIAAQLAADYKPISKTTFSCYGEKKFRQRLEELGRHTLVLVGIETHICVLQTALECLAAGYAVLVVVDGIGARTRLDHDTALERMKGAGIGVVTWEMAAYEWMRRAGTPNFKKVLPHIKSGLATHSMRT